MEDGVTETESLKLRESYSSGPRGEQNQEKDEGTEETASGFIDHLICHLVSGGKEDEGHDEDKRGDVVSEEKEEEKEGGVLSNIISSLVSPKARAAHEGKADDVFEVTEEGQSEDGGLVNNLISSIFHQGEKVEAVEVEEQEKVKAVEGNGHVKAAENEGGGGGGLIESLISHLPTPLADDAAPATDEASILIHAIVHD